MKLKMEKKAFFLVLLFSFLILFAQTRSFLLLLDGLTYVSLAKNILRTGEWFKLSYSPEQFIEFYHHPPLAIWMQAMVIKFFGFNEPLTRILPSSFAFFTVIAVFWFTRKFFSLTAAFYAGVVLFTSTRFVKWGSNFYLDGIFGFFCFLSFALWLVSLSTLKTNFKKGWFCAFISGFLISCAFMTKGVVSFGMVALSLFSISFFFSSSSIFAGFIYFIGMSLPILIWVYFAEGWPFIERYIRESVLVRMGGAFSWEYLIHPWRNIYKLWWPWCPLFLISFYTAIKKGLSNEPLLLLILLAALSFPIGFSLSPFYLEHYLTPFYPFAAVLVGVQLSIYFPVLSDKGLDFGYGLFMLASLYLATLSPTVHEEKFTTPVLWVQELKTLSAEKQVQIKNIAFSEKAADIWLSIASVQGKTPWLAYGNFNLSRESLAKTVLIVQKNEVPSASWVLAPCLWVEGYLAFTSKDLELCR